MAAALLVVAGASAYAVYRYKVNEIRQLLQDTLALRYGRVHLMETSFELAAIGRMPPGRERIDALERYVAENPDDDLGRYRYARELAFSLSSWFDTADPRRPREVRVEKAISIYRSLLEKYPDDGGIMTEMARLVDKEEAIALLERGMAMSAARGEDTAIWVGRIERRLAQASREEERERAKRREDEIDSRLAEIWEIIRHPSRYPNVSKAEREALMAEMKRLRQERSENLERRLDESEARSKEILARAEEGSRRWRTMRAELERDLPWWIRIFRPSEADEPDIAREAADSS